MGMHTYHKVKDMLCEELENVANKGELTAGSLDIVDKLTHSIKSIDTIIAMSEYEDDYSERGGSSYMNRRSSRQNPVHSENIDYGGTSSYARRDSRGRYSRDDNREHMINKLEDMAMNSTDERMRATINKCISELERD